MSVDANSDISKTSVSSGKSGRSRKSLSERIRELGLNLRPSRVPEGSHRLQYVDLKMENAHMASISIMTPVLNLEQITYYQPEISLEDSTRDRYVYKIDKFETTSTGHRELRRISDIEVKSFKPAKKMKFRRRKRHSSIITRVEGILNRGLEPMPEREPSEESIWTEGEEYEEPDKTIGDIPENILQKIFFYLPQRERNVTLPRVCKSWYYILKDPVFWTELEFSGNRVPTNVIVELIRRYPTLEILRVTSIPNVVSVLQELCRCNNDLKLLKVRQCSVSSLDFGRIILHIVSCCNQLEELDIKGMQLQSERLYLELGRLRNLRSVNLTGNRYLRSQDLVTLSVNCRALEELKILDTNIDSSQGSVLKDDELIFIMSHLQQNLKTLKIDMHQLGNLSYQVAILKCSQLQCLALKNCLLLTSEVFRQFPVLTKLKKLKLTRGISLKSDDFQHVFNSDNMRKVEDLDLNGCWNVGEVGLRTIANRLPSLRCLSLKNCKSIRRNHLTHLSKCSRLTYLNLAHTDVDYEGHLQLPQIVKTLRELVVGSELSQKSWRPLKKALPALTMKMSYSEYHKDEREFTDF